MELIVEIKINLDKCIGCKEYIKAEEVQAQAMTVANERVSFTLSSLDCITCMPVFKRKLVNLKGIESVKPLPMLNKIVVEFSPADVSEEEVKKEVINIAEKAGLAEKIIFGR